MMHSQEATDRLELTLSATSGAAGNVLLINEALTLLQQKRRTLEEKAISRYFHSLTGAYGRLIAHLHNHMSKSDVIADSVISSVHRLRTVNEKVSTCVEALLKILKYDLNFLEQYFEYDYCSKLLNEESLISELEEIAISLEKSDPG